MSLPTLLPLAAASSAAGAAPIPGHTGALLLLCLGGLGFVILQQRRAARRLAAIERLLQAALPVAPTHPAAGPAPAVPVAEPPRRDTGELVAAIAAACHVALGARVRIVALSSADDFKPVWSLEGRRQIFASHQVR